MRLVLAAVSLTVLASTLVAVAHTADEFARSRRTILVNAARVFAAAVAKGVESENEAQIYDALVGMRAFDGSEGGGSISFIGVEALNGRMLADLGQTARLVRDSSLGGQSDASLWAMLRSRTIQVVEPVRFPGREPIGRLILVMPADGLMAALMRTVAISLAGGVAAIGLGLAAALRMQRSITQPVLSLAATMARVRDQHDFHSVARQEANDEVGQLVGSFNAMMHEIRERDVKLADHRAHLEQQVLERTHDLSVAKNAAETANAAKSDFLATMSHEIRTPMNGVLVMAELLSAGDLPARQRRYAEVIARSGKSLLAIINDILDLSKVEAGKMEVEQIPVDPAEAADTVLSLFWERAQNKGLDLAAHVAPDTPATLLGDPVRLNQVIGNLVNNAIKFTERGHVLLSIGLDPHDPSRLRFAVSDTGIGIPADKIDKLFSAFSQVDQSTTRKFGGTGLGLAISKRLVEAMGGSFRVTSEAGRGSTFAFSIPVRDAGAARALPRAPALDGKRPLAIVAVRGDATARVAADHLAACGYGVERRDPAELAGPDGALPACDVLFAEGSVLAAASRQSRAGARRVVALTTMGDGAERQLETGGVADALLVRPLAAAELDELGRRLALGQSLRALGGERRGRTDSVPRFQGRRVLVADDSPVNREVAVEALARLGVQAEVAVDGRGAVEIARRGGVDLILMDGSMPEMDGFEASRRIRALEAQEGRARLPIIALTAHVVGSAADAWTTAGMDGILHKPFTIAALAESLAPWLAGQEGAAAPAPAPLAQDEADPAGEAELLDPATFGELEGMASSDGGAFLARIVGLYVDHAPKALAELEASLDADPEDQAKAAHALKSMSFNIGAVRVAALAGACEKRVRVDGGRVDAAAVAELREQLDATLAALEPHRRPDARKSAA
ncbi:hybrid sensor histidine kinase/response regulator [Alsobacter sp. SYSU BS001988]